MTVQHAISKAWHLLDVGPVGFTALLHLHRCAVLLVQLSLILGGAACYIKSFQCAGPKLNIAAEHSRLTLTLVTSCHTFSGVSIFETGTSTSQSGLGPGTKASYKFWWVHGGQEMSRQEDNLHVCLIYIYIYMHIIV